MLSGFYLHNSWESAATGARALFPKSRAKKGLGLKPEISTIEKKYPNHKLLDIEAGWASEGG